ncbi:MAG TPA: PAS domain-containing protein, partial [Halanaerobiales bacterium]|nr:PAS domain-containing protein [Halanaerobiales bacterium]
MKKVKKIIGENKKLEVIINSTSEGLIFVNQQQEIELFNKAAERIMKLKKKDVLGKKVREVIPNTRMHIV